MSDHAYDLYQRGMAFLESGHPAQAAVLFERARRLEPDKASIREALGRAYFNYGQYDLAKHHFEKAISIDPTNDYAHFGVALSLQRLGRFVPAAGHIKLALAMSPKNESYQELARRLLVDKAVRKKG